MKLARRELQEPVGHRDRVLGRPGESPLTQAGASVALADVHERLDSLGHVCDLLPRRLEGNEL